MNVNKKSIRTFRNSGRKKKVASPVGGKKSNAENSTNGSNLGLIRSNLEDANDEQLCQALVPDKNNDTMSKPTESEDQSDVDNNGNDNDALSEGWCETPNADFKNNYFIVANLKRSSPSSFFTSANSSESSELGNLLLQQSQRLADKDVSSEKTDGGNITNVADVAKDYTTDDEYQRYKMLSLYAKEPLSFELKACHSDVSIRHRHKFTLGSLPDDVLFFLFNYLRPQELCQLSCVCQRFHHLISKDAVWVQHARRLAAILHLPIGSECSAKELCRVASRWKRGTFKENLVARHKRLIPWVQKVDDELWFSVGNIIQCFHANPAGQIKEDKELCLVGLEDDVTRFFVKNDRVVSGCRDGSVLCWELTKRQLCCYKQVHHDDTQCVDFTHSLIISGSRDQTCKVLRMADHENTEDALLHTFSAGERVWSLKISPCESFFAAGLAGCLDDPPIILWDIESGECISQLSVNHRRGAGILDLKFESPHELLTCGYDTFIRRWDLRTQTCVQQWEEPQDSALYCIESDGTNSILVGTARHGMVRLWDKRLTEPVQGYYSKNRNSPVYSLAVDYGHLYLALDVGLNIMDFTLAPQAANQLHKTNTTRREKKKSRHLFKR